MLSLIKTIAASTLALTVAIGGATRSLESALEEHRPSLMAYVMSQVRRDRHVAEDVLQYVALTVATKARRETLRTFRDDADFRAHLFTIANNKLLKRRRAQARARETEQLRPDLDVAARRISKFEDLELCELILKAIPRRYAEALRVEHLGEEGQEQPAYVRSRAMEAAQKFAKNRGLTFLS